MSAFDYLDKEEEMILAMQEEKHLADQEFIDKARIHFIKCKLVVVFGEEITANDVTERAVLDYKEAGLNFDNLLCDSIASGNNAVLHELLTRALHDLICEAMESDNV